MKSTEKRIRREEGCPACGSHLETIIDRYPMVYRCAKCEAIYGSCSLGESYGLVLPYMANEEVPDERIRYFDLLCLASGGLRRRHGWYDTETKRIVQIG